MKFITINHSSYISYVLFNSNKTKWNKELKFHKSENSVFMGKKYEFWIPEAYRPKSFTIELRSTN